MTRVPCRGGKGRGVGKKPRGRRRKEEKKGRERAEESAGPTCRDADLFCFATFSLEPREPIKMPSGTTAPVCSLSVPFFFLRFPFVSAQIPPPRSVSFPRKTFLFPSFRKASSDHVKGHDRGVLLPPSGDYSFNQGKRVAHRFAERKMAVQQWDEAGPWLISSFVLSRSVMTLILHRWYILY